MFSWKELSLKKRISVLAPMEDVTDTVFRQIIIEFGRPDVFFTEFTNLEGMFSKGRDIVEQRLRYMNFEKPLIAQVWGLDPKLYMLGAQKIELLGFDGMDINMGCPKDSIIKSGACSALINNHSLAKEIILASNEGVKNIPISIKTRIGFDNIEIENWLGFLLEFKPKALTVHLRTVKELSKVPAHFEQMIAISKLRNQISPETVLICNGDINTVAQGEELCNDNGFDGYMIGRGALNNPMIFAQNDFSLLSTVEKLKTMIKHIQLFENTWGNTKNYDILKKYFKIYINSFEGAAELRDEMMHTKSAKEGLKKIESLLPTL